MHLRMKKSGPLFWSDHFTFMEVVEISVMEFMVGALVSVENNLSCVRKEN